MSTEIVAKSDKSIIPTQQYSCEAEDIIIEVVSSNNVAVYFGWCGTVEQAFYQKRWYVPNNSLCAGANGLEVLVAFEDGEACVADLDGVEVRVARGGRHGASGRRVGHGPPRLENIDEENRFTYHVHRFLYIQIS